MLFDAKLAEAKRQFHYVGGELEKLQNSAHPNLQARIKEELKVIEAYISNLDDFQEELRLYRVAKRQVIDTWRQHFKTMKELCNAAHFLRVQELPASLIHSSSNHWMSNILEMIHEEIGLTNIHPIASLHQMEWFAVIRSFPEYPIYVMPDTLAVNITEIALIYHEVGHTLFSILEADFPRQIEKTIADTFIRKFREASEESDPHVGESKNKAASSWQYQAQAEMEETVCDIVGTLLGGPAFAIALSIGLLTLSENPFVKDSTLYPPLEVRVRITEGVLEHRGFTDNVLDRIRATWQRILPLYSSEQDRWFRWLYDDKYLNDMIRTVERYFVDHGIKMYEPEELTLRGQINVGASLQLDGSTNYQDWITTFATSLEKYVP